MKKLSERQIQELYTFTRKRLVEHYDLQTELVDHLANGIESQWKTSSEVPFNEALANEFKKFGYFGFKAIVKKRKKVMLKKYRGLILRFYKAYFQLPKILLVIGLSLLLFVFLQFLNPMYKLFGVTLLFFAAGFYCAFCAKKNRAVYENKIVTNQKRWMLEEKIYNLGEWSLMAMFPGHICSLSVSSNYTLTDPFLEFGICVFTVCYLTLSYVMVFVIPKKAEELLAETYPEYKLL